jgi:peptidoglycan/LPS O-acetylase OafA/YrhL
LNVPAWSISTEFWTYGIFAVTLVRFKKNLSVIAAGLVVCALSLAFYISIVHHDCLNQGKCLNVTYDAGFMRCIGSFFLGVLAFKLNAAICRFERLSFVKWLDFALLGVLLLVISSSVATPAIAFATPFVAAALVAVLPLQGPASYALSRKPFLWLGKMSFAIYLGHQSVLTAMEAITKSSAIPIYVKFAVLAVTLGIFSVLANRFIEEPGRRYIVDRIRRLTRPKISEPVPSETEEAPQPR